jgi:hypothetical protein
MTGAVAVFGTINAALSKIIFPVRAAQRQVKRNAVKSMTVFFYQIIFEKIEFLHFPV